MEIHVMDTKVPKSSAAALNSTRLGSLISQVAVVGQVNASALGMTKLDRDASRDSDSSHNALEGTAKVNVIRLPGAEAPVNAIKAKQREGRQCMIHYTTQWGTDRRLMPNVNINPFIEAFELIRAEHDLLVREFVDDAPRYIAKAQANLGDYNVNPPSIDEIKKAFSLDYDLHPVPQSASYGDSTLNKELQKQLAERYEDDLKTAYAKAQKDALVRVWEPLSALVDRMEAYDEREENKADGEKVGKHGTFKSTIITNITDMAQVFRSFNLTGDAFFDAVADKLDAFEGIEHASLTKNAELRKQTA